MPGIGWAMSMAGYPLVSKEWNTDKHVLDSLCAEYGKMHKAGMPVWVCIFPEGTFCDNHLDKALANSKAFCEGRNIAPYTHVLTPRTKGTSFLIEQLQKTIPDLELVDLTIRFDSPYNTSLPLSHDRRTIPNITNFMQYPYIHDMHADIRSLPIDSDLYKVFVEKEAILQCNDNVPISPMDNTTYNYIVRLTICWLALLCLVTYQLPLWLSIGYFSFAVAGVIVNSIINR